MIPLKRGWEIYRTEGFSEFRDAAADYFDRISLADSCDKTVDEFYYRAIHNNPTNQKSLVHDLAAEDEFVLIILDACRYDCFANISGVYFSGPSRKAWSAGSRTPDWVSNTWTGTYDLDYVSGSPWISDAKFESRSKTYRPGNHLRNIIPVWRQDWDHNLVTIPPSAVTDAALRHLQKGKTRMVVHYMQPHKPYIFENDGIAESPVIPYVDRRGREGEGWVGNHAPTNRIEDGAEFPPRYDILEQIQSGVISPEDWQTAYRDNLRGVLSEAQRLIQYINPDCRTIITADHGELLGERSLLLNKQLSYHPPRYHPKLREVPWLEVNSKQLAGKTVPESVHEPEPQADNEQDGDRNRRLKDLGYLS